MEKYGHIWRDTKHATLLNNFIHRKMKRPKAEDLKEIKSLNSSYSHSSESLACFKSHICQKISMAYQFSSLLDFVLGQIPMRTLNLTGPSLTEPN